MGQPVSENENSESEIGGRYAKYVLFVLVLVYVFNFIDRQILSILAEEIKADIGISDAQIGFLYGTAFAVFYAVFGIPLGRLADVWVRKSLISLGLSFWSVMTALSGTARDFGSLAVFRFGVGVGEASATPAAFSMLSDYFFAKGAGHSAGGLLQRDLYRCRDRYVPRRHDRRHLERRISGYSDRAVWSKSLAGGVFCSRDPWDTHGAMGAHLEGAHPGHE